MYQGDFMEEDRYDDWPILYRQQLQDEYLSLLDHLIRHYFDHEDHLACTTMCHKILAIDPFREETHRYLMCSYLRQGHPHLALRQYHLCVKMLREELDMTPTPETTALYEQIRQAERV
jgi:DNA-binding SARP family transcriptional activator